MKIKMRLFRNSYCVLLITILIGIIAIYFVQNTAFAQNSSESANTVNKFSDQELNELVAPIALYPDDLLAHVLPASTVPLDIVQAARYLEGHGGKVDKMPDDDWDPSVKALLNFPDVLKKMNKEIAWTEQLGAAFTLQQKDVINAIQQYRKQAYDAGNLKSSDRQKVVVEQQIIKVEPSNPEIIYVPQYNPNDANTRTSKGAPVLTFAAGVAVGNWFRYRAWNPYYTGIVVQPVYHSYYNYRLRSRYYRPPVAGVWRPYPTAYNRARTYTRTHTAAARTSARGYAHRTYRHSAGTYAGTTVNRTTTTRTTAKRTTATPTTAKRTTATPTTAKRTTATRTTATRKTATGTTATRTTATKSHSSAFSGINSASATKANSKRGAVSRGGGGFRRR